MVELATEFPDGSNKMVRYPDRPFKGEKVHLFLEGGEQFFVDDVVHTAVLTTRPGGLEPTMKVVLGVIPTPENESAPRW